jgi:hypothetical protein
LTAQTNSTTLSALGRSHPTANSGRSPSQEARISPIYIGEANELPTILADADIFYSTNFGMSDDVEVADIGASFDPFGMPPYWLVGQRTSLNGGIPNLIYRSANWGHS